MLRERFGVHRSSGAGHRHRVAIASSTLGSANRGFERFAADLAVYLRPHVDVTLLAGGPSTVAGSRRLPVLPAAIARRAQRITRRVWSAAADPPGAALRRLSFALAVAVWATIARPCGIICLEPFVSRQLTRLRRWFRIVPPVLHIDGLGLGAEHLVDIADVVQVMSPSRATRLRERAGAGLEVIELPHAVDVELFAGGDRLRGRRRLEVDDGVPVLLSVAALNRGHKRVDHLIEAAAEASWDGVLVLCGLVEDASLLELAADRLPGRFRHVYVGPDDMPDLYAAADAFVIASLEEGFCLAAIEALAAGLPVIAHDSSHFRWLLEDAGTLVDMRDLALLQVQIAALPAPTVEVARRQARAFSWARLLGRYVDSVDRLCAARRR